MTAPRQTEIKPQAGPQEMFLANAADICIYGGGAGGGKSFALLLEALRHTGNKDFGAVIFRRTSPEITNQGGLWDEAGKLYPRCGAVPKQTGHSFAFPSGATVRFAHLQHDKTVHDWQGTAVALIGFDELTHFSEKQFFYMLSRNRSMCGVAPYVRGTCNPDPDSWLRSFLAWWIDEKTGYAIPERAGVVRWFVRVSDKLVWSDTRQELLDAYAETIPDLEPKSVTFIPASVYDNKILLAKNPQYLSNLQALPLVDRERLLGGNWNIRWAGNEFFAAEWFNIVPAAPPGLAWVRYYDIALSTKKTANSTASVAMAFDPANGNIYLRDLLHGQWELPDLKRLVVNVMKAEKAAGYETTHLIEIDGIGLAVFQALMADAATLNFDLRAAPKTRESKTQRAYAWQPRAAAGKMKLVGGGWIQAFLREVCNFRPDADNAHDDIVDTVSGGFDFILRNYAEALG